MSGRDIATTLPDPSSPTFIPLLAALGAFVGAAIGRLRRLGPERTRQLTENWAFALTAIAIVVYLIAAAAEL
jgi:hypothetical protein